jgi:DNA polymerase I-like protein with 3'-5' exonuclease and polymerase domains
MVLTHEAIQKMSLKCHQLAFVHDELQFESQSEHVNDLKSLLELTAQEAGEYYKVRIPIAAESKSGATWADVH